MKTFTLKELINYIPTCIICSKQLVLAINGNIKSSKQRYTGKNISVKTKVKDSILESANKNYNLSISLDDGEIIEGVELVNNLMTGWMYVKKQCKTCCLTINTTYNDGNLKNVKIFPPLKLTSEDLSYTMPGGKEVKIYKQYYDDQTMLGERTQITINGKLLPPFPFYFDKIDDLKHLNKRLLTVRTFQ